MLTVDDVFLKSYKLYNQSNFNGFSKAMLVNNLNSFEFKNLRKIKYLVLSDQTVSFEEIVNFLSVSEDEYGLDLIEFNINIDSPRGNKLFFELLDFYCGYGTLKMNIISDSDNTPFELIHNVFNFYEINNFINFGLSLNLDKFHPEIWFDNAVLKTINKYLCNGYSVLNERYYLK